MRQTILGFNQEKAISLNLKLEDLLLLQYIMYANSEPTMSHIVEDEIAYVWLNHNKIQTDLPILGITEGTLKNKLCALKSIGLINSITRACDSCKGSRTYYTITNKTIELFNNNVNESIEMSSENDVSNDRCHPEMTSNNILNNNNSNIVNIDKSIFTTTANADCDSVSDFLIKPKTVNTFTKVSNTNESLEKSKTRKPNDPENSKSYKNVVEFINSLKYNDTTKEILLKWYNSVGVGKVSVKMLKDKICRLYETVKTEKDAAEAFNNAYINSWLAFYPPKHSNKNYTKPVITPTQTELKRVDDSMLARNEDGTLMEISR